MKNAKNRTKNSLGKEKVGKKLAENGTKKMTRKSTAMKAGMSKTHTRYRTR